MGISDDSFPGAPFHLTFLFFSVMKRLNQPIFCMWPAKRSCYVLRISFPFFSDPSTGDVQSPDAWYSSQLADVFIDFFRSGTLQGT